MIIQSRWRGIIYHFPSHMDGEAQNAQRRLHVVSYTRVPLAKAVATGKTLPSVTVLHTRDIS